VIKPLHHKCNNNMDGRASSKPHAWGQFVLSNTQDPRAYAKH